MVPVPVQRGNLLMKKASLYTYIPTFCKLSEHKLKKIKLVAFREIISSKFRVFRASDFTFCYKTNKNLNLETLLIFYQLFYARGDMQVYVAAICAAVKSYSVHFPTKLKDEKGLFLD